MNNCGTPLTQIRKEISLPFKADNEISVLYDYLYFKYFPTSTVGAVVSGAGFPEQSSV